MGNTGSGLAVPLCIIEVWMFGLSILLYTQGNWDIHAKVPVNLCVMETNTSLDRAHLQKLRGHVHDLATHILRYELPENVICRIRCDAPIEPVMQ